MPPGQAQAWALVPMAVLFACPGGLLVLLWMLSHVPQADLHALDNAVLLSFRATGELADPLGPAWLEDFVADVTRLGGRSVLGVVGLLVASFLATLRQWRGLAFLAISLIGGALIGDVFKSIVERPRPDLVPHLVDVTSKSLPSGHAAYSATAYLTFSAFLVRIVPARASGYVTAAAVSVTILVGFSRIYLGVHYPSDVLAGWSLGSAWALASWFAAYVTVRR